MTTRAPTRSDKDPLVTISSRLQAAAAAGTRGAAAGSSEEWRTEMEWVQLVHHEVRAPLAALLGWLEMLGDGAVGPLTEEQQQMLGRIENAAERLAELVTAMVNAASAELAQGRRVDGLAVLENVLGQQMRRSRRG